MRLGSLLILILATLRLTRFVTQDWLGHWWIVRPSRQWALSANPELKDLDPDRVWSSIEAHEVADLGKRVMLVKGLDCPFCVGFWIGVGALLASITVAKVPGLGALWRFGLGALALNYVTGHVSSRLDG